MAIIDIPTGALPYEVVEELPSVGAENKIYGVPQTIEGSEFKYNKDYRYHNGEWEEVNLGSSIFGFLFADYQESVQQTVGEMQNIIDEQQTKITELEEAVFPKAWVSFDMTITSLVMAHLDLYDADDNLVEEGAFTTDIYEKEPMTFQTEIRKGTYYLKNSDGYALGLPSGEIKPLVYDDGTTVELGEVEVIMLAPKKGGKK